MHFVQVLVDGIDQVQIHLGRDIIAVQRRFEGVGIMPGLGKEFQLLVLGIQQTRSGILKAAEAIVKTLVGILSQNTVCTFLSSRKSTLGRDLRSTFPFEVRGNASSSVKHTGTI